ncbi:molybdenum cofactor biosynthesis protein MoaC [Platysternon megacephalum]|uniref:Molybdenum cofactor biosynthesis protein MoaC n=1 Tax=Platysternon megacephalum TaxID=55544 RepID=A0A4D9DE11_9SAUR|nr:molybdenum cofactor biosynthesis protein MoaC [Platysternon megacephalum]
MAEKGPCPGLDASLRSEDLLSDMEPLPLSAPATPAQPFGSEVTAQLYASLRRSRQAELDACSQLQPPDLDALAEELSRTLSAGVEASARRKQGGESRHVAEMETVRSRLRTMLQDSRELPSGEWGRGGTLPRQSGLEWEQPPRPRGGRISAPGEGSLGNQPPRPRGGCISALGEGSLCHQPPAPEVAASQRWTRGPWVTSRPAPEVAASQRRARGPWVTSHQPQRWPHLSTGRGVPG